MTPKQKAEELVDKFTNLNSHKISDYSRIEYPTAKQCSLIAVDEIIEGIERALDEYEKGTGIYVKNRIFYWDFYSDVKQEIEKL